MEGPVLYSCSDEATEWEISINCSMLLKNSQRFREDKKWGEMMNLLRNEEKKTRGQG